MPDRQPYRTFNFRVEIDGIGEAQFAEVVVPDAEIAVVEYREGADKTSATRKLPGPRQLRQRRAEARHHRRPLAVPVVPRRRRTATSSRANVAIVLLDAERQAGAPLARAGRVADEVRRGRR